MTTKMRTAIGVLLTLASIHPPQASAQTAAGIVVVQSSDGLVTSTHERGQTTVAVGSPRAADPALVQLAVTSAGGEKVIVEMKSPPVAKRGLLRSAQARASVRSALDDEHARVIGEILRLERAAGRAAASPIRREFTTTFNGIAATLSPANVAALRAHPDVLAIHLDAEIRIVLDESVPLVKAPDFWASHGNYRGAGQVIAVIDSGIDYTHADLGGCVQPGPSCKVVGGYDFVHDDADPRDDHGHGTHVAATAAGEHGVAPEAMLLAYKVLDASGSGEVSALIAALDAAVDPDGDLDTSDHADVVNISLGYAGSPDSPDAQAVDSASDMGVAVVVAAGNNRSNFTIVSPGVAREAITVGAVTNDLVPTNFSSRGPVSETFAIKPEIAAPGFQICAARAEQTSLGVECGDDEHVLLSGTSMATPHVTGATALLRGIFPSLSPPEIKSLLVQSGASSMHSILQVGASTLDVASSASAHTVVAPQTLGFGLSDRTQMQWQTSLPLIVRNLGPSTRSYAMSAAGHPVALPAGVTVSFNPSSFSLTAGQSRTVEVSLQVDNTAVPDQSFPYTYEAMAVVASGGEQQRIPLLFLKTSYLRVHTDRVASAVYAHAHGTGYDEPYVTPTGTTATLLLPSGTYDIIVVFDQIYTYVLRENVVVSGSTDVSISSAEAVHNVTLTGRDELNQPLGHSVRAIGLFYRDTDSGLAAVTRDMSPPFTLRSNSFSSDYHLDLAVLDHVETKSYFVSRGVTGLSADASLTNSASELTRGNVRTYLNPGEQASGIYLALMASFDSIGFGRPDGLTVPGDRELWVAPAPRPKSRLSVLPLVETIGSDFDYHWGPHYRGGATVGEIEAWNSSDVGQEVYRTTTGELPIDLGPASFFMRIDRSESGYGSVTNLIGQSFWSFHSPGGDGPDAESAGVGFELANSSLTSIGVLPQYGGAGFYAPYLDLTSQESYEFVTESLAYKMGGLAASVRVRLSFDTANPGDKEPPWLRRLEVRTAGRLAEEVPIGQTATITIEAGDELDPAVLVGLWRVSGAGETPIALTALGAGVFEGTVTCTANGGFAATIEVLDHSGNSLRQEHEPLFVCGVSICGDNVVGPAENCDDGNQASGDCCSESCQIEADGSSCSDEVFCNGVDRCVAGLCTMHSGDPCASGSECANLCNEASDNCFLAYGTPCSDDGSICSLDFCNGSGSCFHPANNPGVVCRAAVSACDVPELCDFAPECPQDSGAGDTDGDGTCDGLDVCTNVSGARNLITPPAKMKIGRILMDTVSGNDTLYLSGAVVLPSVPAVDTLDFATTGARLMLRSATGATLMDVSLPVGPYEKSARKGWTFSPSRSRWSYKDKSAAPTGGITGLAFSLDYDEDLGRLMRVKLRAKYGTFPISASDVPVNIGIAFGSNVHSAAGVCAESAFLGSDCELNGTQTSLQCRR